MLCSNNNNNRIFPNQESLSQAKSHSRKFLNMTGMIVPEGPYCLLSVPGPVVVGQYFAELLVVSASTSRFCHYFMPTSRKSSCSAEETWASETRREKNKATDQTAKGVLYSASATLKEKLSHFDLKIESLGGTNIDSIWRVSLTQIFSNYSESRVEF